MYFLRLIRIAVVLFVAGAGAAPDFTEAKTETTPEPYDIRVSREEWQDSGRQRTVPVKIYLPSGKGPYPVIVHSHGLGGNREGSTYILEQVARAGFLVVALQHPGSDSSILQNGGLANLATSKQPLFEAAALRYGDLPFIVNELEKRAQTDALAGKADLSRIGMSGHSFGALGTLVALGQALPESSPFQFREPRIKAAVVYSPNKPRYESFGSAFAAVQTPIMHFTGTEDRTPLDLETTPWERTVPFQQIKEADQFLLVLQGGDHAVFSGRRMAQGKPKPIDAMHLQIIADETIRFWRAYLAKEHSAKAELCDLTARTAPAADSYVKATHCGSPTPIKPVK